MESISSPRPATFLARPFPPLREQTIARLHTVRDPHTDLSIVQFGMVEEVKIDGQHIVVMCRYPQAWYSNDTSLAATGAMYPPETYPSAARGSLRAIRSPAMASIDRAGTTTRRGRATIERRITSCASAPQHG